uniref:Lipoprotein n=1 Tax=Tenacibaculum sp. Pbs-1 TaxID=3238748 RepID=A0AB33KTW4_9FLAO
MKIQSHIFLVFYSLINLGCTITNRYTKDLKGETLFILFEKSESTRIFPVGRIQKDTTIYKYSYFYSFKENNFERALFNLNYSDYHDFDDAISQINKSIIFEVDKSFLKKNKEIILTKEILDKIGGQESFKLLLGAETFFLIDKAEVKNNKILIREVKLDWENIE